MKYKFMKILLTTTSRPRETQPSNKVRKYYSDPIPIDLLIEIISRVPAKSIARFHCVSKLWESILGRPYFSELFLTNSMNRPRLLFTVAVNKELFFYSSPQPWNPNDNSCLTATRYHSSFLEYYPTYQSTSLRGLVLLHRYEIEEDRVICNPATGERITLPKVPLNPKSIPKVKAKNCHNWISGLYLGYDPIDKQFKVLCMTSSGDERPNTHMVLTLENNGKPNSWRRIDHKFRFRKNCEASPEICINGILFFGVDRVDQSTVIVSFDVRSEKFGFINNVDNMSLSDCAWYLTLFNYKGKLGIHRNGRCQDREVGFWVLEDAGNHRWSQHIYALSDLEKNIVQEHWFVGMTSTGYMVWSRSPGRVSHPFYLFFYNLESKTFTRIDIQGFKEGYHTVDTFLDYAENVNVCRYVNSPRLTPIT